MHFLHCAHASVQVEVGAGLFPDHSQSRPADILLQNCNLGGPVALDISVVSPPNPSTLAEAGATFRAVLEATTMPLSAIHQGSGDINNHIISLLKDPPYQKMFTTNHEI